MHQRIVIASLAGAVLALGCGNNTTQNTTDGGTETPVVTPTKLGQSGESCTRSADCAGDLICISQQCAPAGTTVTPPATPKVSARGETCSSSHDCATGLVCWDVYDATSPYMTLGRCDFANFGITPTGKTCSAECVTSADCMEIPIPDQPGTLSDGGATNFRSCEDLRVVLAGTTCSETSAHQRECFLVATYCSSTANPWTCTSGACQYTANCVSGNPGGIVGGCPSYSRSGITLSHTTCNTAGKCAASSVAGCTGDATCAGKPVQDDPTDSCSAGECICHAASASCYRKCANNLECAKGFVCSTAQYCVAADTCETDAFCAVSTGHTTAKCVSGSCKVPCTLDLQCSPTGLFPVQPFLGQVCHSGYCEAVGCSSNTECSSTVAGSTNVRTFCVAPPDGGVAAAFPHSAITN